MSKLLLLILSLNFFCLVFTPANTVFAAEEKMSSKNFLDRVRHPAGRKRWAIMDGKIIHRQDNKTVKAVLYLGILFNSERTLAQVVINKAQGYMVGQEFAQGSNGTSIIPLNKMTKEAPIIGYFGLRPEDLTMTFLYWKFVKEYPEESTKMIDCRVFMLESPDSKETAKVWIAEKYFFPIKVEWTKAKDKEPSRVLEVDSFKTQGNYGVIKRLDLHGPGWRTKINFTKTEIGTPEKGAIPKDLFLKLK
jgi:hypothetical protein